MHTERTLVQQEQQDEEGNIDTDPAIQNSDIGVKEVPQQSVLRPTTVPTIPASDCVLSEVHNSHTNAEGGLEDMNTSSSYPIPDIQSDSHITGASSMSPFSPRASSSKPSHSESSPHRSPFPPHRDQYPLGPLKGLSEHNTKDSYTNLQEACLMRHFAENLSFWVSSPRTFLGKHLTKRQHSLTHVIAIVIFS